MVSAQADVLSTHLSTGFPAAHLLRLKYELGWANQQQPASGACCDALLLLHTCPGMPWCTCYHVPARSPCRAMRHHAMTSALPLRVASWLKLYCVFAMQIGSLSKPMAVKRCEAIRSIKHINSSSTAAAAARNAYFLLSQFTSC